MSSASDWPRHYLADVERAREGYPELRIRSGIEVDYYPEMEGALDEMLSRYQFDYVLGSVYCLDALSLSVQDEARAYFAGRSAQDVCARYFEIVALAAASGLFDVIAHLDLYRRFGLSHYGAEILTAHAGVAEAALREMGRRGMGLEVNAAAFRHGQCEPYPALDLLKLARSCRVPFITLGADAHRPSQLGQGLERARSAALEAGYREAALFASRRPMCGSL